MTAASRVLSRKKNGIFFRSLETVAMSNTYAARERRVLVGAGSRVDAKSIWVAARVWLAPARTPVKTLIARRWPTTMSRDQHGSNASRRAALDGARPGAGRHPSLRGVCGDPPRRPMFSVDGLG